MSTVLVGTASWTDKALIESGAFYPPEIGTTADRLGFYAHQFPVVEVDSAYYSLPTVRESMVWVQRTPPSFVFDVRVFRLLTQHQTAPDALPRDIRSALGTPALKNVYYQDLPDELRDELWLRFLMGIEPLRRAGKLGVVLFQFPPWFVPSAASFDHLALCVDKLPGCRLAVELRNRAWFEGGRAQRIWDFEREHGLAHVVVDEPQGFPSSVPALWQVTCPEVAILRLHGRNKLNWEMKGLQSTGERFNYLYPEGELRELADQVHGLAEKAGAVHVLFNNSYANYAQRNAARFTQMLDSVADAGGRPEKAGGPQEKGDG